MFWTLLLVFNANYIDGIVAGIDKKPVFWSEVVCRAKLEKVKLVTPNEKKADSFVKKRVYDRLIVEYHRLDPEGKAKRKKLCDQVSLEAKMVLKWVKQQQTIWGKKSEISLKKLLEQLEQQYEVSWR